MTAQARDVEGFIDEVLHLCCCLFPGDPPTYPWTRAGMWVTRIVPSARQTTAFSWPSTSSSIGSHSEELFAWRTSISAPSRSQRPHHGSTGGGTAGMGSTARAALGSTARAALGGGCRTHAAGGAGPSDGGAGSDGAAPG
eukprot:5949410-Amphidinium_carterae.1